MPSRKAWDPRRDALIRETEREIHAFLGSPPESTGWKDAEVYKIDFDLGGVVIPDEVYYHITEEQIDEAIKRALDYHLWQIYRDLRARRDLHWLDDWLYEIDDNSGDGWFLFKAAYDVLNPDGRIRSLEGAKSRLTQLRRLRKLVAKRIEGLKEYLNSPAFWGKWIGIVSGI